MYIVIGSPIKINFKSFSGSTPQRQLTSTVNSNRIRQSSTLYTIQILTFNRFSYPSVYHLIIDKKYISPFWSSQHSQSFFKLFVHQKKLIINEVK